MICKLPALFIGSSVEGLSTAYAIQQALDYDAEPTVWNQGVFQPSQSGLFDLVKSLSKFDFSVFVFSPDDTIKLRGNEFRAVRDNVIFELGLFMGALGPSRCFYLVPRNAGDLHLPSDLAGITPLTYNASRSDENMLAALGPACNDIRKAIKLQAQHASPFRFTNNVQESATSTENASEKLQRYIDSWNGEFLTEARKLVNRTDVPMSRYELEDDNQAEWDAFTKIFYFLESVSAAILASEIDSDAAKKIFGKVLPSVWKHGCLALSPPNHSEDFWNPLPHIAQVSQRWSTT